jgi:hypothetical protein
MDEVRIPMSGFVFTVNGLFHDLDATMHDDLSIPTYLPQDASLVLFGDEGDLHPSQGSESDDFQVDV